MPRSPILDGNVIQRPIPDDSLTILGYWRIIYRARRMIVGLVVSSVMVAGLVSKAMPKLYETKTTLLTVKEETLGGGISFGGGGGGGGKSGGGGSGGGSGSIAADVLGKSGAASQADVLNVLFRSRAMAMAVVQQLNLMNYYETDSLRGAMGAFQSEASLQQTPNKAFEIVVLSRDPKMAAEIANTAAANLDRLNKEYNTSSTKRMRIFIEARLAEKSKKLDEAENMLKEFRRTQRVLGDEQTSSGALAAADLHGQIVGLQVELAGLREFATADHPRINQLEAQIKELQGQLDRMEQDQVLGIATKNRKRAPLSKKFYPAFEEAPALGLSLLRLNRQVKVEEAVYGMLVGMLESARITEAKDLPTLQVMDSALPPDFPSKPTPLKYMGLAGVSALVFGILLTLFLDHLDRLRAYEALRDSLPAGESEAAVIDQNGNGSLTDVSPVPSKAVERMHG
ncbi:MAG: hypothetical protein EPO61_01300 [Nitrospirae bacterium]|nr:MAG: hypothetical protein EPO61_01300 [Nitrospirota bacterium]